MNESEEKSSDSTSYPRQDIRGERSKKNFQSQFHLKLFVDAKLHIKRNSLTRSRLAMWEVRGLTPSCWWKEPLTWRRVPLRIEFPSSEFFISANAIELSIFFLLIFMLEATHKILKDIPSSDILHMNTHHVVEHEANLNPIKLSTRKLRAKNGDQPRMFVCFCFWTNEEFFVSQWNLDVDLFLFFFLASSLFHSFRFWF